MHATLALVGERAFLFQHGEAFDLCDDVARLRGAAAFTVMLTQGFEQFSASRFPSIGDQDGPEHAEVLARESHRSLWA